MYEPPENPTEYRTVRTLKDWLARERLPHYSGINARASLRRLVPRSSNSHAYFHLGVRMTTRDMKALAFRWARQPPV